MHGSGADSPPTSLLRAYRSTRYVVLAEPDHAVAVAEAVIGTRSPELDAVLARHDARSGVFITAWNPRSAPQPRAVNEAAHERLEHDLRRRGIRFLAHVGVGADSSWDAERGVFALDLPQTEALALAVAYGQNAVVAVERGQPARLALTELMPMPPGG